MKRILVWHLPVRLMHWLLAVLFLGAFALANLSPDGSARFAAHALLGLGAVFLVLLRLLWGVVGTRYARFGSFDLRPAALGRYLRTALSGRVASEQVGHNPATSWFAIALFAGLSGLGATGTLLGLGDERFEELHEALAWSVLALVALHVAGVLLQSVRTRENVAATIVTGRKLAPVGAGIPSARLGTAVILVAIAALYGSQLVTGFDGAARRVTIPIVGTTLTIGDDEEGAGNREEMMDADSDDDAEDVD